MNAALKRDVQQAALLASPPHDASILRVLACGSVDDGKSTLLGRLLYDSNAIMEDQLSALDQESRRWGTQGGARDFALLLDGLSAEREQGITIDVAHRYFSTRRRSFIVLDAPGHEQYTRNMATGASNADLAIILVDAVRGMLPQTRRHAFIAATLGVPHAVLAVNKMDLVGFSREAFERIADEFGQAVSALGFRSVLPIPICAREGDGIVAGSDRMGWFTGPTLLEHLESVAVEPDAPAAAGSLPVQLVLRPDSAFRGYAGTVANGTLRAGQEVLALPSGQRTAIARIVTASGDLPIAVRGQSVTVTLADEIDVSRGDVLAAAEHAPQAVAQVSVRLLWMQKQPLAAGQEFVVQLGTATANARVARIAHAIDIESYESWPAAWLAMNEIGLVDLEFDKPLVAAAYEQDRVLGALILVDRLTNRTVGMAVIDSVGEQPYAAPRVRRMPSQRQRAWLLGGAVIGTLTAALTRDLVLASVLGLAELALLPVLDRIVGGRE